DERLRLAAREERRAVGARQNADANLDRAHRARVAAIDARLAIEDLRAHDFRLQREAQILHFLRRRTAFLADAQLVEHAGPDRVDRFGALLLLRYAERGAQGALRKLRDTLCGVRCS